MKKVWTLGIAVVAATMLQAQEPEFTVSPMFGYIEPITDRMNLDENMIYGLRIGHYFDEHLSGELGLDYMNAVDQWVNPGPRYGSTDIYHLTGNLLYDFLTDTAVKPYGLVGIGGEYLTDKDDENRNSALLNAGLGVRWDMTDWASLRAEVRDIWRVNNPGHRLAYMAGLYFPFGGQEKTAVAAAAPLDSDGDGVADAQDNCPDTPKGVAVDAAGCPLDSDGDGVPDYMDTCANTPAGVEVDTKGCPLDGDGDGIPDYMDNCPDTPSIAKVDAKGCPLDSDGDGVPDYMDRCPNTPKGFEIDASGCTVGMTLEVRFKNNSVEVDRAYSAQIIELANYLKAFPAMNVEIDGHTDSTGSAAYNLKLSKKRAEAVKSVLMDYGIKGSRIIAKGFGEAQPVADNATEEGRQQNRRIEALLIK